MTPSVGNCKQLFSIAYGISGVYCVKFWWLVHTVDSGRLQRSARLQLQERHIAAKQSATPEVALQVGLRTLCTVDKAIHGC